MRKWGIVAIAAILAGCGLGGGEAGTVSITGTVTLDGQPVDGASVAFIGNGGARLATAQTDSTGKFTLNAATGKNTVTVAKGAPPVNAPAASDEPMLMPTEGELAKMPPPPPPSFPAKYGDPKTSGLSFDIQEGMSSIDLALSSK
jgi:hypothetical protein